MLSIQEMAIHTDEILSSVVPELPQIVRDRLTSLSDANLKNQFNALFYESRCWQAEKMGFNKITLEEMFEAITGLKVNCKPVVEGWQTYEWFQSPTFERSNNYSMSPTILSYKKHLLSRKVTCKFGCLDYLKKDIPYGVVLKMADAKELKLFNAFHVMAPLECWLENNPVIDPIVVATILDGNNSNRKETHYFLAQW